MPFSQQNRHIAIETPLGEDAVLLRGFHGSEHISHLFSFQIDLLSESSDISFEDLIGKDVTFRLRLASGENRFFNGIVSRISQANRADRFAEYRAEVVPWLWFLTRTSDCRIFSDKTVPQIVSQIFDDLGFSDYSLRLKGSFDPREYCVQYRETDFNFVSRILEEEGIFYFFMHENGKHTLVLANDPGEHKPCPVQSSVRYDASTGGIQSEDEVFEWNTERQYRPGSYAVTDYFFEAPKTSLAATAAGDNSFETYDFPGEYTKRAQGQGIARTRLQEQSAFALVSQGSSTCRSLAAGFQFTLTDHYRQDQNRAYTLLAVHHQASEGGLGENAGSSSEMTYSNHIECIPWSVPFRPQRVTPVPTVPGCQTAVVTGPEGEEIYTDKYGRVKVQFHWDREGKYDQKSSCWLRVSQPWAGKGFGAISVPRIGQEVIVAFLEGDPDQPIVVGRVYNAEQTVPYGLPDEKTKSTMKTLSSKGGGNFNELRFEDNKGGEQIFLHAAKNFDTRVRENNISATGGELHSTVEKDAFQAFHGDAHLKIKGDFNQEITGTVSMKAGSDWQTKAGQNFALDAGTEIHLKAGMNLVIESGTNLTLKVGGNFVNINPAGVFISGTMVMINSGGSAGSGSGSSPHPPKDPKDADKAEPGSMSSPMTGEVHKDKPMRIKPVSFSPAALVLQQAAQSGAPFCDI